MKTNLSSLMNVVAEEERKFSEYGCSVNEYAYNTSIQELDGKVNVIEDYTEDFNSPIVSLLAKVCWTANESIIINDDWK